MARPFKTPDILVLLNQVLADEATMAERVAAFEVGGSLIRDEDFSFYWGWPVDLRERGTVKTPIPRIDPSDY